MTGFALVPSRTALINVDLQRCFVQGSPLASPDGPAVVERVNRLARACRQAGALVVHTRMSVKPDRSDAGVVMTELVPAFLIDLFAEGAGSAELHDALEAGPADIILGKPRYGAFHGTDLEQLLRSRGIDTVIITGIATNICCETTAREAAQHDFHVFFVSDATATIEMGGVPAEDLQRATCASLGQFFAQVVTLDDIVGKFARAVPAAEQAAAAASTR
jgi:biuret amidohydrolase